MTAADVDHHIRVQRITNTISVAGMQATLRHSMLGTTEIGIPINDDHTVWGELPLEMVEDKHFTEALIEQARVAASRP